MKKYPILRVAALLALMLAVAWFFAGEVKRHWDELSRVHMELRWHYILIGVPLVLGAYLVATLAWQETILLASRRKLTYIESIGLVNISQLTKYIPGKVWSYAIQMHLLAAHDISKAWVLTVNIIMLLSLVTSAAVIGFGYIYFSGTYLPQEISLTLLLVSFTFYLFLVFGGAWSVNVLVRLANALLKKQFAAINLRLGAMIKIHGLYLISNLLFGIAGYFVAVGLGLPQDFMLVLPIAASMLLSDTIGFFAFVVPGGIGVREGIMYAMLRSVVDIQTCFILPVAFRLVTTVSDLLLGGAALFLLHTFEKKSSNQIGFKRSGAVNEK